MPPEPSRETPEAGDIADVPRPREQTRLVGHEPAEAAFVGALRSSRLHHAWLIGGPRGIGKATLAYRIARWLAANPRIGAVPDRLDVPPDHPAARQVAILSHPNVVALRRVQAPGAKTLPTRISVEAARKALALFAATAGNESYRVCIVDSAEDLNANSANALLKMVEEPPPRSLFLIVSHAPARLLPTIRSRCRALALRPLTAGEVRAVVEGFPAPFETPGPEVTARAADLAEGSVSRAVAVLDSRTVTLLGEIEALLGHASDPDWRRVLKLADALGGREAEDAFAQTLDAVQRFLSGELDRRMGEGPARLARIVEAADRIAASAREAAIYNLDRRALVLSIFGEVSAALRVVS